MKSLLVAAGLALCVPVAAHAQVVIQTPAPPAAYPEDYWRHDHDDWKRREEYKEQAEHAQWEHSHCVRDWQNTEYCRR